jgi:hypothetical protein
VEEIYASADFPAELLDEITNAESCADAAQMLQSGSGGGDCQFAANSYIWYSCKF